MGAEPAERRTLVSPGRTRQVDGRFRRGTNDIFRASRRARQRDETQQAKDAAFSRAATLDCAQRPTAS